MAQLQVRSGCPILFLYEGPQFPRCGDPQEGLCITAGKGLPWWLSPQLDAQLPARKTVRPRRLLPSHGLPRHHQKPLRHLHSKLPFGEICLSSPSLEAAQGVGRLIYPLKGGLSSGCHNLFPDFPLHFLDFAADSWLICPTRPRLAP